jgi:hypothetical protein
MKTIIQSIPWSIVVLLCLTLGLAPYSPEPHVIEKLQLLISGRLHATVDVFDFLFHLSPFIIALIKLFYTFK